MESRGYYAVDLDGTLAQYDHFRGSTHIGEPVPAVQEYVKRLIAEGKAVKIFTARVAPASIAYNARDQKEAEVMIHSVVSAIAAWSFKHLGVMLPVTATKDFMMISLIDDRCIQVIPNTGVRVDGLPL